MILLLELIYLALSYALDMTYKYVRALLLYYFYFRGGKYDLMISQLGKETCRIELDSSLITRVDVLEFFSKIGGTSMMPIQKGRLFGLLLCDGDVLRAELYFKMRLPSFTDNSQKKVN